MYEAGCASHHSVSWSGCPEADRIHVRLRKGSEVLWGPSPDPAPTLASLLSPAQWDGKVEDRQHERARVFGEQVADDGGRDGGVAGLADAYQTPGQDQQPEVLQEGRRR